MTPDYPLLATYKRTLPHKIEEIREVIRSLQKEPSLQQLDILHRLLHKFAGSVGSYGYLPTSKLLSALDLDVGVKIQNFHLEPLEKEWLEQLDSRLKEIEKSLEEKTQGDSHPMSKIKKNIVVIDDDEDIVKLLDYEFSQLGFSVISFMTGEKALQFLSDDQNLKDVFLIIFDRILPDRDGLEVLKQFKKGTKTTIPLLVLSQLSSQEQIVEGLQSGAIDYITKPFSVFMLMQKALNLLKIQP